MLSSALRQVISRAENRRTRTKRARTYEAISVRRGDPMKSDIFHAYDPTSVRESMIGVRMTRPSLAINDSQPTQQPTIGYKLPFSSDLVRYSTRLERRNDDIPRKATPCRICPQYGHALIFPRKCYYEAQCPLPLLFCVIQNGERPVRTSFRAVVASTHPKFPTLVRPFLRRLSSTISKHIAYNDPTQENTNFGWRKKA